MNIYVGNLKFQTKNEDLKKAFQAFGEVSSAKVITDRDSGRSRGFGFVEMPSDAKAQEAIDELNGTMFDGRPITVNKARERGGRRGGGGGGYDGGGGGRDW
jgi:RNA recognition motif-containing protein